MEQLPACALDETQDEELPVRQWSQADARFRGFEGEATFHLLDDEREAPLRDAAEVVGYASDRYVSWHDWLLERERDLLARDPDVESPRGRVTYRTLLDSQRWHAAFHYRQLLAVLDDLTFYDREVLVVVVLAAVLGSVYLDYRAVRTGRVPYVEPAAGSDG